MGGNLYPALIKLLREADREFVRQAKGSHEIWFSPVTGRPIVIPKNTVSRHTANGSLVDAGLPKAF